MALIYSLGLNESPGGLHEAALLLQLAVRQGTTAGVKITVAMTFEVCGPVTGAGLLVCVSAGIMLGSGRLNKGHKL